MCSSRVVSSNPTLHGKEQQRHQRTETAENDAQGEKGSEGVAGAVSSILDFRVIGMKDQRGDRRRCSKGSGMRQEMPPCLGSIVMRTAVAQATDRLGG
jgi:hypothetical protein